MANIFQFKPKIASTPEENLNAFIHRCRNELTVFGNNLNWKSYVWPKIAVFSKLGVITRKPKFNQLMNDNFIEFAKAYFRYQQGHRPTGTKNELKALRAIESALIQVNGHSTIAGLSITCLDEAIILAKQHYSSGTAYHCGREIERLSKFVSVNNLISCNLKEWKSPISRPIDTIRTGKEAKVARDKKLPNEIALNSLAEIFANNPFQERDIFTTSVFAILMSAPSRISEILALPVDCEVVEVDSKGVERYGWRFYSGKGFGGDIKWIPSVMVEIAKISIQRIKKLTAEARQLAKWIENNPDKFYRHKNCPNVSDDHPLTMEQACLALGLNSNTTKNCRSSLSGRKLEAKNGIHTLNTLWQHVKDQLPNDFPWFDKEKKVKYSNALFVLHKNQLHGNRGSLPIELYKPTNNFFSNDLSPRESLEKQHKSIFDRYGYFSETGERLKITSHQARHLLNTIAQRGGLSNLEIAKWSGRADVKQNRIYNHMTDYEMVAIAERIDTSKTMFGPIGNLETPLPVTTQEFNALEQAAVHITEYGYCVHDYTMSPCEKYRDCINCTEQVCIKGNSSKLERIKERLEKTEKLLLKVEKDVNEDDIGADRWFSYHKKTATRLHELIDILENPKIENGAQIKLRGNDFSQLRRVAEKKMVKSTNNSSLNDDEASILENLTKMLGGKFG